MKKFFSPETVLKCVQILLGAAAIAVTLLSIADIRNESMHSGSERLEVSVRRSVKAFYASEGVYPPDIQYLRDRYGLQIDDSKYVVIYSAFAENLMPEITVTELS